MTVQKQIVYIQQKTKTYLYVHAPPATVFMQDPQCQIPTALLFILVWKYKLIIITINSKRRLLQKPKNSHTQMVLSNYTYFNAMCKCPYLATERAGVFGVLGDFNFLHHLPQRRAITRAVFTNDPHLLRALGLRT